MDPETWAMMQLLNAGADQQDQLDYTDDLLNTAMDPAMMFLSGNFDPTMFESTFEEDEVTPAVTAGRDRLLKIQSMSPGTEEARLASALLDGYSGEAALQAAQIQPIPKLDSNNEQILGVGGEPLFDTSKYDRMLKKADDWYDSLVEDQDEVRTPGAEIAHPMVEWAQKNGFADPRQGYTNEMINPILPERLALWEQEQSKYNNLQELSRTKLPSSIENAPKVTLPKMTADQTWMADAPTSGALPQGFGRVYDPMQQIRQVNAGRNPAANNVEVADTSWKPDYVRGAAREHQRGVRNEAAGKWGSDNAKAEALKAFLVSQGRTPIGDQMAARLRGVTG